LQFSQMSETPSSFRVAIGPLARIGETVEVRFTIPENPLTLEIGRLAVAEEPPRKGQPLRAIMLDPA